MWPTNIDFRYIYNYCYMDEATNKLITNFVVSSVINISKRNIARSKKRLKLAPTPKKFEKWHVQIDLKKQIHSKKVYTDMASEYWFSSNQESKRKEFATKVRDCAKTSNICFYSRKRRKCSPSTITTTNNFSKFVITFLNRQA